MESPATILKGGDSGPASRSGQGGGEPALSHGRHLDDPVMPPSGNSSRAVDLTPAQLALLKLWINQGAKGSSGAVAAAPQHWERTRARRDLCGGDFSRWTLRRMRTGTNRAGLRFAVPDSLRGAQGSRGGWERPTRTWCRAWPLPRTERWLPADFARSSFGVSRLGCRWPPFLARWPPRRWIRPWLKS